MKKSKIILPVAQDGEWIQPVLHNFYHQCCDCGLIHRMDFKIGKHKGKYKMLFRAFRVPRSTTKIPVLNSSDK